MGPEKSCRYAMILPAASQLDTPLPMWGQAERAGDSVRVWARCVCGYRYRARAINPKRTGIFVTKVWWVLQFGRVLAGITKP